MHTVGAQGSELWVYIELYFCVKQGYVKELEQLMEIACRKLKQQCAGEIASYSILEPVFSKLLLFEA